MISARARRVRQPKLPRGRARRRVRFARVDEKRADGSIVLYFTHK